VEHSARFELAWSIRSPDLQSSAFSRSATSAINMQKLIIVVVMIVNGAESGSRTDDLLVTTQLL
jgi:hypothetical protein